MKLRPYQIESVSLIKREFARGNKRVVLCLPTGAGKTVVFADIVRQAAAKMTQVLVLTDRIELFKQTIGALPFGAQTLHAGKKNFDPYAIITMAMVETYKRRNLPGYKRRNLPGYKPQLIIIDEAHKQSFNKVLDASGDAFVIGATATPVGKHMHAYYNSLIAPVDIPELVADGFLSPCRPFQMVDDFSDLEVKRGEYTDKSLYGHFNNRKLYSGVVDEWQKLANGKKTIVFNVNIDHTIKMAEEFRSAGILTEYVTSETPKLERARILRAFQQGLFPVLCNCGILTTGYDEPSIECVIMNRKTKSLPLWLQCCGRGSRIYPGKEEFIVLDFGMNHDELGLWDEPRTWSLKPPPKRKPSVREAAVKNCPDCSAMVYASARECKHCGHIFPPAKQEEAEGVMVEVKGKTPSALVGKWIAECTLDELILLQTSGKYKPSFIQRVIRSRGEAAIMEYAQKVEYKPGWVRYQIEKAQLGEAANFFNNFTIR